MNKQRLKKTLLRLAGHLVIDSDEQQNNFDLLYKSLAKAALPDDKSLLINTDFSIEKARSFTAMITTLVVS